MVAETNKKTAKAGEFTDEEKVAMKARTQELKIEERMNKDRVAGESAVLEAIAALEEPYRTMARRFHEIVEAAAPDLMPKTWYGMPAYARNGNVICFFQSAQKFNSRYSTFGFNDKANLDNGNMWPTSFALKELGADEEARIIELVKKAVS